MYTIQCHCPGNNFIKSRGLKKKKKKKKGSFQLIALLEKLPLYCCCNWKCEDNFSLINKIVRKKTFLKMTFQ